MILNMKRGLPNAKNATEAFRALLDPVNVKMLTESGEEVFTKSELEARYHILAEKYAKDILIEGNTMKSMVCFYSICVCSHIFNYYFQVFTHIIPAVFEVRKSLAETVVNLKSVGVGYDTEKDLLKKLGDLLVQLQEAGEKLAKGIDAVRATHENMDAAAAQHIVPCLSEVRKIVDSLELTLPDKYWPFPKYTELLFSI